MTTNNFRGAPGRFITCDAVREAIEAAAGGLDGRRAAAASVTPLAAEVISEFLTRWFNEAVHDYYAEALAEAASSIPTNVVMASEHHRTRVTSLSVFDRYVLASPKPDGVVKTSPLARTPQPGQAGITASQGVPPEEVSHLIGATAARGC